MTVEIKQAQKLLVLGLGGCGSNAVNHMYLAHIPEVELVCANTDISHLRNKVEVPYKIQLGPQLVRGQGVGGKIDLGESSARESIDLISELLEGVDMLFVTAGMGGGTGTGSAPVVAEMARERGILTVGVVTTPLHFEGSKRMKVAQEGIRRLYPHVDSLIVIPNEKIFSLSPDLPIKEAYSKIDQVLYKAVMAITDIITRPAEINVDFQDVRGVMSQKGYSLIGQSDAMPLDQAAEAVHQALKNPFLSDIPISQAKSLLVTIQAGPNFKVKQLKEVTKVIEAYTDPEDSEVVYGQSTREELGDQVIVSIVISGLSGEDEAVSHALGGLPAFESPPKSPKMPAVTPSDKQPLPPLKNQAETVATDSKVVIKNASRQDLTDWSEVSLPSFFRQQND